jgi:hypothetical protein
MCVTVTVVTGHSVALNRRSHLFSTMSSLHDILVHDNIGAGFCLYSFINLLMGQVYGSILYGPEQCYRCSPFYILFLVEGPELMWLSYNYLYTISGYEIQIILKEY